MSLDRLRELEAQLEGLDTEPLEIFRVPSPPKPSTPKPCVEPAAPKIPLENVRGCDHTEARKLEVEELYSDLSMQQEKLRKECETLTAQLQRTERRRNVLRDEIDGKELKKVMVVLEKLDRKTLDEIVSYSNPPQAVRNTIECVYLILYAHSFGKSKPVVNWLCAKEMITRRTFKGKLLSFNTEMLLMSHRKLMSLMRQKIYFEGMDKLDLSPEPTPTGISDIEEEPSRDNSASDIRAVAFASQPCGTLFRWCERQLLRAVLLPQLPRMQKEMEEQAILASEARSNLISSRRLLKTVRERFDRIKRERAGVEQLHTTHAASAASSIFPQVDVIDLQEMARRQWKARRIAKEAATASALAKRSAFVSAIAAEAAVQEAQADSQ
jgi:hypothetical protein